MIAISDYVKSLITSRYIGVDSKLTVVHRGVDTAIFDPVAVSQSRIINFAESISLPEDIPVIMLPARASLWKGHHILFDALAKLGDMPFMCLLVGAADGKPNFVQKLTDYANAQGLEGRFRLTPVIDNMPAALMVADVVVMPSVTPEPFGRVAIEAQAMGRPVVAFAHGGAMESIQDGETGWLATPCDSDSLAESIKTALSLKPAARTAYAKKAQEHIKENFSTAEMCNKTLKIYQRVLLKTRKKPAVRC